MKLQDLRQFEQFSQLSDEQLILIKPKLKMKRCSSPGEVILPIGFEQDLEFFLLKGRVLLTADDGHQQEVLAGSEAARLSIARLRPSLYEVTSAEACELLAISGSLLSQQVQVSSRNQESSSFSPQATTFYNRLKKALDNQTFCLPSLPSVALKVREVLQQPEPEIKDLERVLNRDPSMLAKLIAAANSPLYRRGHTCQSSGEAIMRLGLDTTSQLVMLFSLRQLFKANHAWVKERMTASWCQGVRVAAIAQLMTLHHPHILADQALLVGLIHNLGELALLKFIDQEPEINQEQMEVLLEELMPAAGVLLLSHWGFDDEILNLVAELNHWQSTNEGDKASLDDLIRVARLHTFIGTDKQYQYPRLDEIPAFQKLTDQGLTPDLSLTFIEDAADQVAEVQRMFGL